MWHQRRRRRNFVNKVADKAPKCTILRGKVQKISGEGAQSNPLTPHTSTLVASVNSTSSLLLLLATNTTLGKRAVCATAAWTFSLRIRSWKDIPLPQQVIYPSENSVKSRLKFYDVDKQHRLNFYLVCHFESFLRDSERDKISEILSKQAAISHDRERKMRHRVADMRKLPLHIYSSKLHGASPDHVTAFQPAIICNCSWNPKNAIAAQKRKQLFSTYNIS